MTASNLSSVQPLERHINIKVSGLAERESLTTPQRSLRGHRGWQFVGFFLAKNKEDGI